MFKKIIKLLFILSLFTLNFSVFDNTILELEQQISYAETGDESSSGPLRNFWKWLNTGWNNTIKATSNFFNSSSSLLDENKLLTLQQQIEYASKLTPKQKEAINEQSQELYGKDTFDENWFLIPGWPWADALTWEITDAMKKWHDENLANNIFHSSGLQDVNNMIEWYDENLLNSFSLEDWHKFLTSQNQMEYGSNLTPKQKEAINTLSQELYGKDTFDENWDLVPGWPWADGVDWPITQSMKDRHYENLANANEALEAAAQASDNKDTQDENLTNANKTAGTGVSSASWCIYDDAQGYSDLLNNCLKDTSLVNPWTGGLEASSWFKSFIIKQVEYTASFLALLAVWSLVYWALIFTLSTWEDEKIKKAKDIIKWWIIWFLVIISSWFLITIIIEIFYSIAGSK